MGFYGPLSIFAFAFLAAFLNKFLMGPVVRAVCKQEAREGDFRCSIGDAERIEMMVYC